MDDIQEIWKDIKGYEGIYQASNLGRIRSLPREWFVNNGRKFHNGIILKSFKNPQGYPMVELCKNGKRVGISVHRLIAITFIPNPENKPEVNHKFGVKEDNRVSQLEWHTPSENMSHAHKIGLKTASKGERCGTSKLKEKDVLAIREMYATKKYTLKELGSIFNVAFTNIQKITTRTSWAHI